MEPFTRNGSIIGSAMDFATSDQYILGYNTSRVRPTLVGSRVVNRAGSTATTNATFNLTGGTNTTPQAGDIVILSIALGAGATTLMTPPSGYTTLAHFASAGTYDSVLYVGYKIMGSTPDTTFPLPSALSTSNSQMATVFVWRNFDASNPIDVTTQTATGANSRLANPPPITPVTQNSVIMGIGACAYSGTINSFSAGGNLSGFVTTSGSDTYDGAIGAGYYDWTSGTFVPTAFTITDSTTTDSWTGVSLAIRSKEVSTPIYGNIKNSGVWDMPAIYKSLAKSGFLVEYLVIAGGGGGGTSGNDSGGGGAGGYRSSVIGENSGGGTSAEDPLLLDTGITYFVSVGAGGAAGSNGGNSTFHTITSLGGGFGADGASGGGGNSGGSGGGAGDTATAIGAGTAGQGYSGGAYGADAGGGGGAGGPGRAGNAAGAQAYGGIGITSSVTGTAVARAGGGGGGNDTAGYGVAVAGGGVGTNTATGGSGTVNTGGGGGGAGLAGTGSNGGSGIVILRYPANVSISFGTGLTGTEIVVGNNRVAIITAGSGNVSWG